MRVDQVDSFTDLLSIVSFAQFNVVTSQWVAAYCDVSRRTAQRYIQNLIASGYLQKTQKGVVATDKALRMVTAGSAA